MYRKMTIDGQNEKDNNRMLPQELLVEVFSHLAPKDLNTVMLVCKTWKNAAEARHTLWSWVKLRSLNHLCSSGYYRSGPALEGTACGRGAIKKNQNISKGLASYCKA